jgi:hypothetical protein
MTKTLLITLTLGIVCVPMLAQSHTKETNMGAQVDVYAEYSPIEEVTISLGEEVSFTNFLTPETVFSMPPIRFLE